VLVKTSDMVFFMAICLFVSASALASKPKAELTSLFNRITSTPYPYEDESISNDISRLFEKSCVSRAKEVLAKKKLGSKREKMVLGQMNGMCSCVSQASGFKRAVVNMAIMLKKQGNGSRAKAQSILQGAMLKARDRCLNNR
jgi:hypothetical protein